MLAVRKLDGTPAFIQPACITYVWQSNMLEAVRESMPAINATLTNAICIHAGTGSILSQLDSVLDHVSAHYQIEGIVGKLRVHIGIGIDGTMGAFRDGKVSAQEILNRYELVSKKIEKAVGRHRNIVIEAIVLNGEAGWKRDSSDVKSSMDLKQLASDIGKIFAKNCPSLVLGISSFGALGYHSGVRPMLEGITPYCSFFTGQSYAAAAGELQKSLLTNIIARDEKSQAATVKQGWMRDDLDRNNDISHDDLDQILTIQGYKTHPTTLCSVICKTAIIYVWALPLLKLGGRFDADGIVSIATSNLLRLKFGWSSSTVLQYQASTGKLAQGNIPGAMTRDFAKKDVDALLKSNGISLSIDEIVK